MKFRSFSMLLLACSSFSSIAVLGHVYVVNRGSDSVSVIDVESNDVIATPSVGYAPFTIAITPDATKALVVNDYTTSVSVIDIASNSVIATPSVETRPFAIAITPDGAKAFVANSGSATVSVIDVASNSVIATLPVGDYCVAIAITPDGAKAFVVNSSSATVSVIDVVNNTVIATLPVGYAPVAIAITPDGTKAFVTNGFGNSVSVIDVAKNNVIATLPVGYAPFAIAITPDGTKAFVANVDAASVSVIDVISNSVIATLPVGYGPFSVAITPDGTKAFVANKGSGSVSIIDVAKNQVMINLPVGYDPVAISITPDGAKAYVANSSSDNISVIDVANNSVITTPSTGSTSQTIAITPDQAPVAQFKAAIAPSGSPSTFDASTSFSPAGSIINYFWDFGDGNTLNQSQALASHIYATPGDYSVTLTVTNSAGTSTKQIFNPSSSFIGFGTNYITLTHNGGPSARSKQILNIPAAQPIITGINSSVDSISGETLVTITGFNFTDATAVVFGDNPAISFAVNSDSSITASVPPNTPGTVDVRVSTPAGTSACTPVGQYTYIPQPSSESIVTTESNPTSDENLAIIAESNFIDETTNLCNSNSATSSAINSDSSITTTITLDAPESVPSLFEPITSLYSSSDPASSETVALINKLNFPDAIVAFFDSSSYTSSAVNSDSSITNSILTDIPGSVDVRVSTSVDHNTLIHPNALLPPADLKGRQVKNKFSFQTSIINILTWKAPSSGPKPMFYRIYKDKQLTKLIAVIPASRKMRFKDYSRRRESRYSYFVVSVDQAGNVSAPAKIVIKKR